MTLGEGYVGAPDMKPLPHWWSLDTAYDRSRPGTDIFIPVIEEDIDGIEDVNIVPDLDGNSSMVIYDLMGRKVTNPRPGNIYIMNGVKVMFK